MGIYQLHTGRDGVVRIQDSQSLECMHPSTEPSIESYELYVKQGEHLVQAIMPGLLAEDCVIWDVGLGAATNVITTLRYSEFFSDSKIISFENELSAAQLALENRFLFGHLNDQSMLLDGSAAWMSLDQLLRQGQWSSATNKKGRWVLKHGDFTTMAESAEPPHLVFYDPFSYKVNSTLWTEEAFLNMARWCKNSNCGTILITYSASTAVRTALLLAGFFVARGCGTGQKSETTVAVWAPHRTKTDFQALGADIQLLDVLWLEKWRRSSRFAPEIAPGNKLVYTREQIESRLMNCAQFKS